jgi:hypothetical protein
LTIIANCPQPLLQAIHVTMERVSVARVEREFMANADPNSVSLKETTNPQTNNQEI